MSVPKQIPPMLDGCLLGDAISNHHGVRCYPALRQETGDRYILKIISVPANASQLDALLLSGACADREQAMAYFRDLADGIVEQAQLLQTLGSADSYEPYLSIQSLPREDGSGYDIQLVSRYCPSLSTVMPTQPLTHLAAVNLGLDLCAALAAARRAGYLYVNLKPDNIYQAESGSFRIGDLGFIPLASVQYASLPEKYRSRYTAPEVADALSALSDTMDIYAIGLILYQLYNNCALPEEADADGLFPTPLYADYELAHIITKACAADPAQRWQDPAQMGQALVDYMQRNGVNNTPIIPEPVVFDEPKDEIETFLTEEENDEEFAQVLAAIGEEEPPRQLIIEGGDFREEAASSLPDPDAVDMADESEEADADENQLSFLSENGIPAEFDQVMALAEDLMTHQPPEPVVVPDPIDVPVPPLPEEPDPEEEIIGIREPENTEDKGDDPKPVPLPVKRRRHKALAAITAALILLCAIVAGTVWYQEFFLQNVKQLTVSGYPDGFQVAVVSDIDDKLLTVVCTDTYGNTLRSPVSNGHAVFQNLNPDTHYSIRLEISGLHKLTGQTTGSYTTGKQTTVLNFSAVCGPESGSAILNFSVTGPDTSRWRVFISAPGEEERAQSFSGHTATIFGLTPGTTYTFRLDGGENIPLGSGHILTYTAQSVLKAENLEVIACGNGSLTLRWRNSMGNSDQKWMLRCYNDQGYDQSVTTDALEYTFTGLDHTTGYTVTVTAEGMTETASISVTADPVKVTEYSWQVTDPWAIDLTWSFEGAAPAGGWILRGCVNEGEEFTLLCPENSARLPLVGGGVYRVTAEPAGQITHFTQQSIFTAPQPTAFEGYGLTADKLTAKLFLCPEGDGWGIADLKANSFTASFEAGQQAGILLSVGSNFILSDSSVTLTYSLRLENGQPFSEDQATANWRSMWVGTGCILPLPVTPDAPGSYVIDLYIDGKIVSSLDFTVA